MKQLVLSFFSVVKTWKRNNYAMNTNITVEQVFVFANLILRIYLF